jgi:hypothetical protein
MFGNMKTPDITLAQILAGVAWVASQAVAMGLIDSNQSAFALQIASTIIGAAWVLGDSIIRQGRAKAAAAVEIAQSPANENVTASIG